MAVTHTVQAGETLWSISRLYGVSLDALRLANALTTDLIYPGQELIIPEAAAQPSETVPSATLPSLEGDSSCLREATPPRTCRTWRSWPGWFSQRPVANPLRGRLPWLRYCSIG